MENHREIEEYAAVENKMVKTFGCDSQNAYIKKCPNCPIREACYLESNPGEDSKTFNNKWEKGMVKAFNDFMELKKELKGSE